MMIVLACYLETCVCVCVCLQLKSPDIEDSALIAYDAHHEERRKEQLEKLLNR